MPRKIRCCLPLCKESSDNRSVHRLPMSQPSLLKKWKEMIGKDIIDKYKNFQICSIHFTEDCFDRTGQITRLKPNAFPSLHLGQRESNMVADDKEDEDEPLCDTPNRPRFVSPKRKLFDHLLKNDVKAINLDHSYAKKDHDYETMYHELKVKYDDLMRKYNQLKQRCTRNIDKITNMTDLLDDLHDKHYLNNKNKDLLLDVASGIPREIVKRMCHKDRTAGNKYPEELRRFALTLNFLSSKAYEYVRSKFEHSLPHPSTLSKWYSHINGEPGICTEALMAIKNVISKQQENAVAGLIFDEMSIRRHTEFDGKRNYGFVDFGLNDNNDSDPSELAGFALVYMVVFLNGSWKLPVAYFLIDKLDGDERASITSHVLESLSLVGLRIVSVTCDGPSSHLRMAELLGANFNLDMFNTKLDNPYSSFPLYFMLDACHCIKLIRNSFFDLKKFYDGEGNEINVEYIYKLHYLQQQEQLLIANKLTEAHINWKKQPMKVKLAVQTLSSSVADALDYCRNNKNMPQFANSEGTTRFIRIVDRLFDLFNSKNKYGRNFKAPLTIKNYHYWEPFLEESFKYISELRNDNGKLMIESRRKTGFLGFLTLIQSIKSIFHKLIIEEKLAEYLLTYKLSQDHVELFFAGIRSRLGYNNNPTAKQFMSAFKRLLIHCELKHTRGNCIAQDNTSILSVTSQVTNCYNQYEVFTDGQILFSDDQEIENTNLEILPVLSETIVDIMEYIAGFVVRKLLKKIECDVCEKVLVDEKIASTLIDFKNRGGLTKPSEDVMKICFKSEQICRRFSLLENNNSASNPNLLQIMIAKTFANLPRTIFEQLNDHVLLDFEVFGPNHKFLLIKRIIKEYITIRVHHINKLRNLNVRGQSVRQQFTKLVLFKHQ